MSLFSLRFALFVAAGLLLYYVLPRKCQWPVLLTLSWVFALSCGARAVGCLLFVTLTTYFSGLYLGRCGQALAAMDKARRATAGVPIKRRKRLATAITFLCNFLLLFFLKYWDFCASGLNRLFGGALPELGLLAPLGVSYYMFQSVGYVIDVYRGKYPPERNFLKYALFVSFFPQITQGPIGRYAELSPQLFARRRFSAENLQKGLQLVLWGCLKKLVVADRAGVAVEAIYGDYQSYGGVFIVFGVLCYCIQLYCDFSGGIDIVRGIAQMFGVEMAENFRRPIFSTSLTDFWRRWHISLGSWMRDYLFYPLALSKPILRLGKFSRKRIGGKLGKILPTSVVTFFLYFVIGVWHGANWKYVVFGLYNGVLITAGLLLEPWFARLRAKSGLGEDSLFLKAFRILRTCLLVFIGRYITRADSVSTALGMLWKTVRHPIPSQLLDGTLLRLGLTLWDLVIVAVGVAVLLAVECLEERGADVKARLEEKPFALQWLIMALGLAALLLLGVFRGDYIAAEFIYQQF